MEFNPAFEPKLEALVKYIADFAKKLDIEIYFVGGLVRDNFLKLPLKDIDFVVRGSAIDFCRQLEEKNSSYRIKSLHHDFNTAKMILDEIEVDFASTREESYPQSGCLPVVKNIGCKISKDLKRRDFTINAIAVRILENANYEIVDPLNGIQDIKAKKLRILNNHSFIDDPTRILRGLDFKLRFKGFKYDKTTLKLLKQHLANPKREGLSMSRVELTLLKLFSNKNSAGSAYKEIIKEKLYKIFTDNISSKASLGDKISRNADFFQITDTKDIFITALKNNYLQALLNEFKIKHVQNNYDIYKQFKSYTPKKLCLYYSLTKDRDAKKYWESLKDIKPLTTGETLLKIGYKEGKQIGIILERLLEEKLNGSDFKNQADEIIWIKNNF